MRTTLALAALLLATTGAAQPRPAAPPPPLPKPPRAVAGEVEADVARAAESHVRRGNEALLDGRAADARQAYAQAQVVAPEVAEIQYDLGTAALLEGDLSAAGRALSSVRRAPPEAGPTTDASDGRAPVRPASPQARVVGDAAFNLGHVALAQGDLARAVQQLAQVVARDPAAEDARRNLELALRMLQEQQQQQEKQQQQNQDQQNQEQENQDQQQRDQQEQEQPSGGGEQDQPREPEDGEQQEQPQGGEGERQEPTGPQPQPGQLSREKAEQLLEMTAEEERRALEKEQQKRRAKARAAPAGKDW